MDFVITQKGWLRLLTPHKRQDYRYYLNNRSATSDNVDLEAHHKAAADKHWALTYFKLQDNQVYRKAEQDKDGSWLKPRYAACTYDACDLICKAHENLHHAGEYITLYLQTSLTNIIIGTRKTYDRLHDNYYGITESQDKWCLRNVPFAFFKLLIRANL